MTKDMFTEERLIEADRLKKAWFDHVLSSLEKLGQSLEKLSSDLHSTKDELYKEIMAAKDVLRSEMSTLKSDTMLDHEKLEKRIEKTIDGINKNIDAISIQPVKDSLKKDIENLRKDLTKELTTLKDTTVTPLNEDMIKLKVKFGMWGVAGGVIGGSIVAGVLKWVVPVVFRSLMFP